MTTAVLLLTALVGHAALWIGAVNRLHGIGLPKLWKEVGTLASFAVLFAVPPLFAWRFWRSGVEAAPGFALPTEPALLYPVFCLPVGCWVMASWLWRRHLAPRARVVEHASKRFVDPAPGLERHDLIPCEKTRWFSALPGNQLLKLSVEQKTLRLPGLPSGLEGLKIAHLSDLHISGRIAVDYYRGLVDLTNEWGPDLVALTGDLIENVACLDWVAPTYGRLEARLGVYFVLGNHDAHGDADELRRRLAGHGHTGLGGCWADLEVNGATLRLAGNEQPWFRPAANLASAPTEADTTFALVHGPDQFAWARRHGVSLVLAGHNHGGQIRFPLIGPIVAPSLSGVRYASGAFRSGETVMHVTRGAGALAPIRYNCPPELSLLTLTGGQADA